MLAISAINQAVVVNKGLPNQNYVNQGPPNPGFANREMMYQPQPQPSE